MRGFTPLLRSAGPASASVRSPSQVSNIGAGGPLRLRLRTLHQSPLSRLPNTPVPRVSASSSGSTSTLNSAASNGSRAGGSGSGTGGKKPPSPHAMWYREIVPAMIPPLLLSLTIFLSLSLFRLHLSHQLSISEQQAQIDLLEQELERLRNQAVRRAEREKRERERMLPVVVGKVLQRVGVLNREMNEEEEEVKEAERLLV